MSAAALGHLPLRGESVLRADSRKAHLLDTALTRRGLVLIGSGRIVPGGLLATEPANEGVVCGGGRSRGTGRVGTCFVGATAIAR